MCGWEKNEWQKVFHCRKWYRCDQFDSSSETHPYPRATQVYFDNMGDVDGGQGRCENIARARQMISRGVEKLPCLSQFILFRSQATERIVATRRFVT